MFDFSALTALLLAVLMGGIFFAPKRGSGHKH